MKVYPHHLLKLLHNQQTQLPTTKMLSALVSVLAILGVASASPLAERQSGVQVVRECRNSGQVALTFDGRSPLFFSPDATVC